jgi:patatin-related protein
VSDPSFDPKQEIRFAVVMYGGVSLCIYINGVAQELLRLVRATSGADFGNDAVAAIYRELAKEVRGITAPQNRVHTRFVIDLLSGTSAGGINAVFLAKALAMRAPNMDQLRSTWLDKADIDKLLDTKGDPFTAKRSLLKGQWMYEELLNAFRSMSAAKADPPDGYRQSELIDLFVTSTDLNGARIPIHLSDQDVRERIHKASFHFKFNAIDVPEIAASETCKMAAPALPGRNDFQPEFDPMLAFVSRCTSSFPVAFSPMRFADIESVVGKSAYGDLKVKFQHFFRWVSPHPVVADGTRLEFDERELADGGYLDNKPFGYVIDALKYRPSSVLYSRKLLYVDPFPQNVRDNPERDHFNFVANAIAAAMELPRYETIREDIERVKLSNRLQERLLELKRTVTGEWQKAHQGKALKEFGESKLEDMIEIHGPAYGTYHLIRVAQVTDDLARTIAHMRGSVEDEDLFLAIRYLARHWRELNFAPNAEGGRQLENDFLTKFDFSFRMRRLIDLLDWSQKKSSEDLSLKLRRQLARLHRTRDRLWSSSDKNNPLLSILANIGEHLSWDRVQGLVRPPEESERRERTAALYNGDPALADLFEKLVNAIGDTWNTAFCHNRVELKELRKSAPDLENYYQTFDFRDMLSLSVLEGSDVSEHTLTEIYRISPADGIQRSLDKKKLAGTTLMDFGAFLKREWRENDILWGRLDATERIVAAILPYEDDDPLRKSYVDRLRNEILNQEIGLRTASDPCVPHARDAIARNNVEQFLSERYEVPSGPLPAQSVGWMGQASTILGAMFKDDLGREDRFTRSLKIVGSMLAAITGFLVPHSIGNILFRYWLSVLFFFCLTIAILGSLFNKPETRNLGLVGTAIVVSVWLAASWLGAVFEERWQRFLGWLIVLPVAFVFWLGVRHLPDVWQWILHLSGKFGA